MIWFWGWMASVGDEYRRASDGDDDAPALGNGGFYSTVLMPIYFQALCRNRNG